MSFRISKRLEFRSQKARAGTSGLGIRENASENIPIEETNPKSPLESANVEKTNPNLPGSWLPQGKHV
jgi:hypothetical protein